MVQIGVLAVQGAFVEHQQVLERVLGSVGLDGDVVQIRRPEQLGTCDGLVLPGGESTTIEKLIDSSGLRAALVRELEAGLPTLATCAGAILVSSDGDGQVAKTGTELLGLLDAEVERNAFGRQRESFEGAVEADALDGGPFPGVFIRAPAFRRTWGEARPWARLPDGVTVGVEQGHLLALAFHPELAGDERVHRYFLETVAGEAP